MAVAQSEAKYTRLLNEYKEQGGVMNVGIHKDK